MTRYYETSYEAIALTACDKLHITRYRYIYIIIFSIAINRLSLAIYVIVINCISKAIRRTFSYKKRIHCLNCHFLNNGFALVALLFGFTSLCKCKEIIFTSYNYFVYWQNERKQLIFVKTALYCNSY